MSVPVYRVISSKVLDNGNIEIKVATEDRKYRKRTIKPSEGGGLLRYYVEVDHPLEMIVMETCYQMSSNTFIGLHFYVSDKTKLGEVINLAQLLPRIRPNWEGVQPAQHEHLNAAD